MIARIDARWRIVLLCLVTLPIAACNRVGCAGPGAGTDGEVEVVGPDRNGLPIADDPFGETVREIAYLDQGWSPEDSQRFYFTSQGTQILPYEWFLALEQPDAEALFRDNQNMLRFRYLPQRPDAMNPDGLPVGFVKDKGRDRDWMGFTCAACHTTQVDYEGVGYRIDGGPALADATGFLRSIAEALERTRTDQAKFRRFAARVLRDRDTTAQREVLGKQIDLIIARRQGYNARNFPDDAPAGHGRIDALGAILNEVFHRAVLRGDDTPPTANTERADAPVSYPFLWDTPQHDRVQWVANVENGGPLDVGSLGRNVGEVLGVFADFEIPENPGLTGYRSTVQVRNLRKMEDWLRTLWSPQWPKAFPPIDETKRDAGAALYKQLCQNCHAPIKRTDPRRKIEAILEAVGTDPKTSERFWGRNGATGKLEGAFVKVFDPRSGRLKSEARGDQMLDHVVIGTILGSPFQAPEDALSQVEFGAKPARAIAQNAQIGAAYKARPLNGIWATAPYLHNGSVPNLYQLLLPAEQRDPTFHVGSRQFDPKHVGFRTDAEAEGLFEFRARDDDGTPIPGNSNAGHQYGADLSDDQRLGTGRVPQDALTEDSEVIQKRHFM